MTVLLNREEEIENLKLDNEMKFKANLDLKNSNKELQMAKEKLVSEFWNFKEATPRWAWLMNKILIERINRKHKSYFYLILLDNVFDLFIRHLFKSILIFNSFISV